MSIKDRADTPGLKEAVIDQLFATWLKYPEMRLGQLLVNFLDRNGPDMFNIEDFELYRRLGAPMPGGS